MGYFFFFQAEDGIRDVAVTGVQTCALPISITPAAADFGGEHFRRGRSQQRCRWRSEERRVGKSVDLGGRRIIKKKRNTLPQNQAPRRAKKQAHISSATNTIT